MVDVLGVDMGLGEAHGDDAWKMDAPKEFILPLLIGSGLSIVGFMFQLGGCTWRVATPASRNSHYFRCHSELLPPKINSTSPKQHFDVHGVSFSAKGSLWIRLGCHWCALATLAHFPCLLPGSATLSSPPQWLCKW